MKRTIYKRQVTQEVKAEVESCPCCGSDDIRTDMVNTGNGCDSFSGYGYVKCKRCGHEVKKHSYNVGYGDSLEGLLSSALSEWNSQAGAYGRKSDSELGREVNRLKKALAESEEKVRQLTEFINTHEYAERPVFSLHGIAFRM